MPYSDNMYSADDVDDNESVGDALSPSDGYFTNPGRNTQNMVTDPSLDSQGIGPVSKAREAKREAEQSPHAQYHRDLSPELSGLATISHQISPASNSEMYHSPYAPSSSVAPYPVLPSSSQPRQQDVYAETSPLLLHNAPPPAYSPSSTQNASPPSTQTVERNYSTLSHQYPDQGFQSQREPETMGYPEVDSERTPLWRHRVQHYSTSRKFIRNLLLLALFVSIVITLTVAIAKSGSANWRRNHKHSGTPSDGIPFVVEPKGSYCTSARIQVQDLPNYEFHSGREISVLQVIRNPNSGFAAHNIRTVGEVILRRMPENATDGESGRITFEVWVSREEIDFDIEMDSESQSLKVSTPVYSPRFGAGPNCLSMEITMWLPYAADFSTIQVSTTQLAVRVLDDVEITVSEEFVTKTIADPIYYPSADESHTSATTAQVIDQTVSESDYHVSESHGLAARTVYAATISGDVTGSFPLLDKLSVESKSGYLDIVVRPFPVLKSDPKPAELSLRTTSGNICARLPVNKPQKIPERDYITWVRSVSGYISGSYILGTTLNMETTSGNLDVFVFPDNSEQKSSLFTTTTSGSSLVKLLSPRTGSSTISKPISGPEIIDIGDDDPYLIPHKPPTDEKSSSTHLPASEPTLRKLSSTHSSVSGTLKCLYPPEWEGKLLASSLTGNIKIDGEGVSLIKSRLKNWGNQVEGRKGDDPEHGSVITAKGISSNIGVWVGNSCTSENWCKY